MLTPEEKDELATLYWDVNFRLVEPFPAVRAYRKALSEPFTELSPRLTPYLADLMEKERDYNEDLLQKKIRYQELLDKNERCDE